MTLLHFGILFDAKIGIHCFMKSHFYRLYPVRFSGMVAMAVIMVLLVSCKHPRHYVLYRSGYQYMLKDTANNTSSELALMLARYRTGMDSQMQATIIYADQPLTKAQPESSLGNIMADALVYCAGEQGYPVTAAVLSYSTVGKEYIAPGPVSRATITEMATYDNKVIIAEVNGFALRQICDTIARNNGCPVSGIRFTIDSGHARNITVAGIPLNEHLVYRVATCSFTARNASWLNCPQVQTGFTVREALLRYTITLQQQGKHLHSDIENRITYAE